MLVHPKIYNVVQPKTPSSSQLASLEDCLTETSIAYMVAGALLSYSFAVLALAYYIWICLVVGLWSQVFPDFVGIRKAQKAVNTCDTPKTPRSTPMPISFTSAAPARPRQITSTTDRAFGRSAPALLEAATLPAVQATALDRTFRTKSIERMMLNTRDTPKTPSSTPTRCSC